MNSNGNTEEKSKANANASQDVTAAVTKLAQRSAGPKLCPSCKRPLPDDAISAVLTPTKGRIYRAIAQAGARGLSREEVMDRVYRNVPGGGANDNVIKVHVSKMNKELAPFGVRIISNRLVWRLVQI